MSRQGGIGKRHKSAVKSDLPTCTLQKRVLCSARSRVRASARVLPNAIGVRLMTLPVNNIGAPAASATLPEETGSLSQIRTFEPVANKKPLDLWQKPGAKAKRSSGHGVEASSRLKDLITLLPMRIVPGQTIDVTRGPAPSRTGPLRGTPLPMRFPVPLEPYKPRFSLPFRSAFTVDVEPKSIGGVRPIGNSQVAQATGSTLDASPKLSLAQLRELNPLAKPADHHDAAGWARMFGNSGFTAPIEGMTGAVSTKPASLGGALSVPAGTKISDANGIRRSSASLDSVDRPPSL